MMMTLLVILSLIGLTDSIYLAHKKNRPDPLACLIGGGTDCDTVVKSKYNKMMGLPNEYWGVIFYLTNLALVIYTTYVDQTIFNLPIRPLWLALTAVGALASVALIYIQGAILKHWCEFCLVSDLTNILIFLILTFNL